MRKTDRRARRGAALIIAIAILTVMLAIGLTFFTVARVESTTAMNVVNTVRAEHLVDAGFAMAEYRLNRDLQDHPQATSLDHAWRTLFNGAAYAGKNWANSTGNPAFNLDPIERALHNSGYFDKMSLLYVQFAADKSIEPLFRGSVTAPWLAIPRWQGNTILLYKSEKDMPLCFVDHTVSPPAVVLISDADVNKAITPFSVVRFDNTVDAAGRPTDTNNTGLFPFVTSGFFGPVARRDQNNAIIDYPWPTMGLDWLWPVEQVDRWADVDANGDGIRDSIWIPLPKDVDLAADGVDNDLDGWPDPVRPPDDLGQSSVDEEGNPVRDFEIGAFVYRVDSTGRLVRSLNNLDTLNGTRLLLTIPLPGLRLPIDMNNDGRIDSKDFYNASRIADPVNGSPVYVNLPGTVNVPTKNSTAPNAPVVMQTLDITAVDTIDNDYDQFVNGFNAYVFLGNPMNTSHAAAATTADVTAQKIAGAPLQYDSTLARTKFANKIIHWAADTVANVPGIMPNITFSDNAPAWLSAPAVGVPPVVISITGEPVCDIVGRAAIQVVDESSKVNMNAAGGHVYRQDYDATATAGLTPVQRGEHIQRAFNQGASTFEYETRALPDMGVDRAADLWGMLTGAGWMLDPPTGAKWDYRTLAVDHLVAPAVNIPYAPLQPYAYDISLPGYGRVDDNMNSLLLAFNGRADAGTQHPDQGLWAPPLGPLAQNVLTGTLALPTSWHSDTAQQAIARAELQGYPYPFADALPLKATYAEVAKTVGKPSFHDYYNLLGMLEGIDDPSELRQAAPLRNLIAEADRLDNNNDSVTDEIGEAGDRLLANHYELQKAVEKNGNKIFGDLTWAKVKNVVTANSDSRNVNYVEAAAGHKAVNKIDPNLAPPAQLAAGLLIKGEDITPVTDQYIGSGKTPKISLPKVVPPPADDPLTFAEGLRQADTTFTGYIFGQPTTLSSGGILNGLFAADPELQAMQAAVNIADSRDADCARSLLVMDRQVTASSYQTWFDRNYGRATPFAPLEPLNERERIAQSDAFPVGDLQDYLITAIGGSAADRRVVSVDDWWQVLTAAAGQREDRTISYAAAGVDAIRINELMVRPVRRVEAEAVTHIPDPSGSGLRVPLWSLYPNVPTNENNLNPTPYPGMPEFDLDTITEFSPAVTQWRMRSPYDTAPTTGGTAATYPYVLGDETAMVYTVPITAPWVPEGDPTELQNNVNDDIIEFRVKTTTDGQPQGLPPGRII